MAGFGNGRFKSSACSGACLKNYFCNLYASICGIFCFYSVDVVRYVVLVFIPRKKFPEKPALVVELKWDKKVDAAIEQIKRKEYCQSLKEYQGNILLVGINYNKRTKKHQCAIEEYQKS